MYASAAHSIFSVRQHLLLPPAAAYPPSHHLFPPTPTNPSFLRLTAPFSNPSISSSTTRCGCSPNLSASSVSSSIDDEGDDDDDHNDDEITGDSSKNLICDEDDSQSQSEFDGVDVEVERVGRNRRRIRSSVAVEADLQTVWNLLTDYERLADFIPGLVVSRMIEKRDNFARLFQVGQQNLTFGLKFNAKGVLDCYEKDPESLPNGRKRDIEFKMVEGDFQIFEGKWSIEEITEACQGGGLSNGKEFQTILSYVVDVKPKLWLPVRFVEGRLSREIKLNLSCIRVEAKNVARDTQYTC